MLKKTVTYIDFDGKSRTEDMYFNMTKSELLEFSFDMPDAMTDAVADPENMDVEEAGRKLLDKLGKSGIYKFIKDLVFKAYGRKSEDGRRFVKSEALSTEFTQTLAYDEFLMELLNDDKKAAEFINAIVPAEVAENMSATKLKALN